MRYRGPPPARRVGRFVGVAVKTAATVCERVGIPFQAITSQGIECLNVVAFEDGASGE